MGAQEHHRREIQPVRGGSERILLVDDEEGIARMMNVMLQRFGYAVTYHTNCLDSLQAFRNSPTSYDLVISDMTMPNMNGLQFASKIRTIRPEIPIISHPLMTIHTLDDPSLSPLTCRQCRKPLLCFRASHGVLYFNARKNILFI